MKKGVIALAALAALLVLGGIFSNRESATERVVQQSQKQLPENPEYYWGDTCPHCSNVAEFLDSWEKSEEVNIQKFEVYNDNSNAEKLQARAVECGLNARNVGVPFMYTTEGECIVGDVPIIDHLKSTYGE